MAFMFEKLDVYQKAMDFIDQITSLTEGFPRGYYFLTDQLNRCEEGRSEWPGFCAFWLVGEPATTDALEADTLLAQEPAPGVFGPSELVSIPVCSPNPSLRAQRAMRSIPISSPRR